MKRDGMTRREALGTMALGAAGLILAPRFAHADEEGAGVLIETQETGAEIWQVTGGDVSKSNIYCEVPYCTPDSRFLVYQRYGGEKPNNVEFVAVEIGSWQERVIGHANAMSGCAISRDGHFFFCHQPQGTDAPLTLMQADIATEETEQLHEFAETEKWTWSLGTVSPDGRYYVRGKHLETFKLYGILLVDLETGEERIIDEDPYIFNAHPQFDPGGTRRLLIQHNRGGGFDPDGSNYQGTGPEGATLYILSTETGERTTLNAGKPHTTRCTGHQAWAGESGEVLFSVKAAGEFAPEKGNLLGVRPGEDARVVASGHKFLHVGVSRCGRLFSCDDWKPPYNIVIGSVATGQTAVVCASKTDVGRKQYTHPHAYLTPDLKWIIFNSTRTGRPQVYAGRIPDGIVDGLLAT